MIIKIQTTNGSFKMYDNVKGVSYSAPNTFYPAPPQVKDEKGLEIFIETLIAHDNTEKTEHGFVKNHVIMGVRQEDLSEDRKIIFIGEVYFTYNSKQNCAEMREDHGEPNEKHCYRFVTFMKEKTEYWVYTIEPVYICSDNGKTIETIR